MLHNKKLSLVTVFILLILLNNQILTSSAISYEWVKQNGSTGIDTGNGIAVDSSGNVYTTGYFQGTVDFDPNAGTTNLSSAGSDDIFIHKLTTNGDFLWAIRIGSTGSDRGYAITIDNSSNLVIIGYFQGTVDFDSGAGTTNLSSAGNNDIFVLKLDTNGNFIWAGSMGGLEDDNGYSIQVDSSDNIYASGFYRASSDFDPSGAVYNLSSNGGYDIFVLKLDTNGNFIWAVGIGGTGTDIGVDIAIDTSGNAYVTGNFSNSVDFDPSASNYTVIGNSFEDIFVLKLDTNGNFQWVAAMGDSGFDNGYGIAVDSNANVYSVGSFVGTVDFDPSVAVYNLVATGINSFVQKLDSNGNFQWAIRLGDGISFTYNIAIDGSDNTYVVGSFLDTVDFDPTGGTSLLTSSGNLDVFVQKMSSNGDFLGAVAMGGSTHDAGVAIAVDTLENIYITGQFTGTADFDPSPAIENLSSAGSFDIFVQKFNNLQTITVEFLNPTDSSLEALGNPPQLLITTSDALPTQTSVTVQVIANGGSATDTIDYQLIGTVSVPLGTASGSTIDISSLTVIDDLDIEANETIDLEVISLSSALIGLQNTNVYTIIDDDGIPTSVPSSNNPEIAIFDPAISKLGFLQAGQVGVLGETLEWIITVSNPSNVAGQNVVIQDTIDSRLQIQSVEALGASVNIVGQSVSVTYPIIQLGETVQFSIFTTVVDGITVSNTACVNASNQAAEECATASPVSQLPQTGETKILGNVIRWVFFILLGLGATRLFFTMKSKEVTR